MHFWDGVMAFFALGAIGFWLAVVAVVILLCFFSEDDGTKATITVVAGAFFLQFFASVDMLHYVRGHPFRLLFYVGVYIFMGLLWSVLKWWRYVAKQRREYDAARADFCRRNGFDPAEALTLELKSEWWRFVRDELREPPQVAEHKADIIRWMTYWPFSLLWTLLNDPIRRFCEFLFNLVRAKMQAISDQLFKSTKNDYLTKEEREELERKKREGRDGPTWIKK